jgi:hypothetical protein
MFINADDYRQRAEKLEKLAEQTPSESLKQSLTSIAANWRAVAASLEGAPSLLPKRPLIDGRPAYHSVRR